MSLMSDKSLQNITSSTHTPILRISAVLNLRSQSTLFISGDDGTGEKTNTDTRHEADEAEAEEEEDACSSRSGN